MEKKREPGKVTIAKIRTAVANYMSSEGCSCCEGHTHDKDREEIARLLGVPKYPDGSGYDFHKFATNDL